MDETEIVIACRVLDPQDDSPTHCMVSVSRSWAEGMMQKKNAFEAVNKQHNGLYCLEFWGTNGADWGRVPGFTPNQAVEWEQIKDEAVVCDGESVELETTIVTDSGVAFQAMYKNDDTSHYFQSCELHWDQIEKLANATTNELLDEVFTQAEYEPQDEEEEEDEDGEEEDTDGPPAAQG